MMLKSLPKNLCNAAVSHFTGGLVPECMGKNRKEGYSDASDGVLDTNTGYEWLNIIIIILAVIYFLVMVGLWLRLVVFAYRSSGLEAVFAFFLYNLYVIYKLANLIDFNTKNTS